MEIKEDETVLLNFPKGNIKIFILAILLISVSLPVEETNVFITEVI